MLRAQELLLVLLVFIANSDSRWFAINGETANEFSLCHRLGFYDRTDYYAFLVHGGLAGYDINKKTGQKELKIYRDEWNHMLDELPNKAELFELNTKNFDIKNTLKGDSQRDQKHRFDFHVISIGQKSKDSYKNIAVQLKQGSIIPPALNLLNKMQRSFVRNVRRMITDTIINNRDIYDKAIKRKKLTIVSIILINNAPRQRMTQWR